jgi:tetratricopeptide (TPR) repeat protein
LKKCRIALAFHANCINTIGTVFPDLTLWHAGNNDLLIIAKKSGEPLDYLLMDAYIRGLSLPDMKAYLNISDGLDFLSYYMMGTSGIDKFVGTSPIITDDRPMRDFLTVPDASVSGNINQLLWEYYVIPPIDEFDGEQNYISELLYRKTNNYRFSGIDIDRTWMKLALAIAPEHLAYRAQWASTLYYEGLKQDALIEAVTLLEADPQNPYVLWLMGQMLKEDIPELAIHYTQLAAQESEDFRTLYDAAMMSLERGDNENALAYFMMASWAPHRADMVARLKYMIAQSYIALDEFELAATSLKSVVAISPNNFNAVYALAETEFLLGNVSAGCNRLMLLDSTAARDNRGKVQELLDLHCPAL